VELLIDQLYARGIRRIVLALGYGADHVIEMLKTHPWPAGLQIHYAVEPVPLGTGGGLRFAARQATSDPVLGLNGDTFCDADLKKLLSFHHQRDAKITIALIRQADTGRYGKVECAEDGAVTRFAEKEASSGSGWINCGVYVIAAEVLRELPANKPMSWERDVLSRYVGSGLYAVEAASRFLDIGTPESLRDAPSFLLQKPILQ
jgi:NDP-sugar pyrophosphorylase family protein